MVIKSKLLVSSSVILSTIILDQVTKAFVLNSGLLSVCNKGVAFGLLQGFPNLLIAVGVLAVFVYLFVKELSYSSSPLGREVTSSALSFPRKRESRASAESGSRIPSTSLRVYDKYGMTGRVIGYSFIIGGSISNILDRFTRGCVVDFIKVFDFFPAFNLSDAAISVGVLALIVSLFRRREFVN